MGTKRKAQPSGATVSKQESKVCFVIMPIGAEGSETRIRSDKALKYIIKPAVETFGYEAVRADDILQPGYIIKDIVTYLKDSPLVIADLTDQNPNVFYELAIRHAVGLPIIQIIKKDEKLPFDIQGQRTIPYDIDVEAAEMAKDGIKEQIQAIERGGEFENPITISLNLQALKKSENPIEQSNAQIIELIEGVGQRLDVLARIMLETYFLVPPENRDSWDDYFRARKWAITEEGTHMLDSASQVLLREFMRRREPRKPLIQRIPDEPKTTDDKGE